MGTKIIKHPKNIIFAVSDQFVDAFTKGLIFSFGGGTSRNDIGSPSIKGARYSHYIFLQTQMRRNILNHWCGSTDICMKQDLDRNFAAKMIRSQSIICVKQVYFLFDVQPDHAKNLLM